MSDDTRQSGGRIGMGMEALFPAVLAWLIPGLGHLVIGQWKKALLYFVLLNGCFIYGGRQLVFADVHVVEDRSIAQSVVAVKPFQNITSATPFHFAAQLGMGVPALVFNSANGKIDPRAVAGHPKYEIATLYTDIAGLLNYLVAVHLLLICEITRGRKTAKTPEQMIAEVLAPQAAFAPPVSDAAQPESHAAKPPEGGASS